MKASRRCTTTTTTMQKEKKGRPRVRAGRSVNIQDWERQSQLLTNWNNELCSSETLPEVEIISLLEEQIPKYKLRADTLTEFGGYENQDWFIPTPALEVDEADLKLSPDQIRETLNYFLLCSDRVSQMTKTYDDIEAVTRLLEEKEKDLELTARIGKELLQTNNKLENTIASLEIDLKAAHEKITQLSHEINKKTNLIEILSNDMDENFDEIGTTGGKINLEIMQKRMASLEDENKALKKEYVRLAEQEEDIEEQEQKLLRDLTGQLTSANSSMNYLEDELDKQKEENRLQHEQILTLQGQLSDVELKLKKYMNENEEVSSLLQITQENQGSLAVELSEFKARYYEVEALLRDVQEQLRKLRKKQQSGGRISLFSSLGGGQQQYDSLQNELEMSMYSEFSSDSGISNTDVPQYKKVFETVRCASQISVNSSEYLHLGGGYTSSTNMMGGGSGPRMTFKLQETETLRHSSGSIYSTSSLGYPSLDSGHSDTEFSQTDSEENYPGAPQKGIPGVPGAADLEAALKRLTPGEVLARRANLRHGPTYGGYEGDNYLPFGCRTPDSLMSTGSGNYIGWKLPEKLQIVKPIEGSQTLHQWSQLAKPTFGGLLDERPGVKIRGGRELDEIGLETYGLSDLEEDEEYGNPGKLFDGSKATYTLTNSTVMHPDDGTTFVTSSNRGSRMASVCSSIQNSPPQTPGGARSRRNSCSTFSTTYGLAKMLNERGIKAVTPSSFNTPSGLNSFTPTATPCNSPDGTSNSTRAGSPENDIFSLPQLILSSVPQFLLDTVGGGGGGGVKKKIFNKNKRVKLEKTESLVGKIERIGITNLMGTPNALSIQSGIYTRSALTSPMAQLTCLLSNQNTDLQPKIETHIGNKVPPSIQTTPTPSTFLGVPGKPGSGALARRLEQLNTRKQRRQQQGVTRSDLGTVSTKSINDTTNNTFMNTNNGNTSSSSTLGTLSSLLFGRKGGLF